MDGSEEDSDSINSKPLFKNDFQNLNESRTSKRGSKKNKNKRRNEFRNKNNENEFQRNYGGMEPEDLPGDQYVD